MNFNLSHFVNATKQFATQHAPEILTGMGVAGMLGTVVLAVKATPKAMELIEVKKKESKTDELTPVETVKAAWKPYVPACVLGFTSTACIIGASAVNLRRNAALATAYTLAENTLSLYKDKVIETIGEKKEHEIRTQIAQDSVNKDKIASSQVIVVSNGNVLIKDALSGRYFRGDVNTIEEKINELNRQMNYQNYISLNEFYDAIGLDRTRIGSLLGWNLDRGHIELTQYDTEMAENKEPCLVLDFNVAPTYDYDKYY